VVDPFGVVVAELGGAPGLLIADLDLERLADVRRRLPALQHRRLDASVRPAPSALGSGS
jgi:nitrilase